MQFKMAFIPAILLTGIVYMLVGAGLLKNNIKQVYSRRTKREKFLTIGVAIVAVVMMLFVAARQGEPAVMGNYSQTLHGALLWLLNGSKDILAMAVYLVCVLPVIIVSAGILDEIGLKNNQSEVPFFFYVLLFAVEGLFYETLATPVTGWFVLMLFSTAVFCKMKMQQEGSDKTKKILRVLLVAGILAIFLLERTVPVMLVIRYIALMGLNLLLSICLNRTSVLKKKVWLVVIVICYGLAFLLGRLI